MLKRKALDGGHAFGQKGGLRRRESTLFRPLSRLFAKKKQEMSKSLPCSAGNQCFALNVLYVGLFMG